MAAVSLKDLMDPLSKIEVNTRNTSQKLDKLIELFGTSVASISKKEDSKSIELDKKAAETLKILGEGATTLIKALIDIKKVSQKSVDTFVDLIKGTANALGEFDNPEESLKAAETVNLIGGSVLKYAFNMALATPLLILAMPGVALFGLSLRLLVAAAGDAPNQLENFGAVVDIGKIVFWYALGMAATALLSPLVLLGAAVFGLSVRILLAAAGTSARNIEAMEAVNLLGSGALKFAGTLALVSIFAPFVLIGAATFSLSLLMVGLALKVLGDKPKRSAIALNFLAIGILAFSASLALSALILQGEIESYLKVGLLLAGAGLIFYTVGRFAGPIIKGAFVIAIMGLTLILFSVGYGMFNALTKDVTLEQAGVQAAILTGVGTVFALAGLAAVAIIPGALAFAAVGISLIFLTAGLKKWQTLKWKEEDSVNLTTALIGIKLAFLGSDDSDGGIFSKIGGAIGGAIDAVKMTAAAAGFISAGISLIFLSKGLSKFKALGWTENDSIQLSTTLGGITAAFAQAGGEPSNPGGLFGAVFGTAFEPNAVERGIDSVMDAGEALTNIAKGLMSFQTLINSGVVFGEPDANGMYAKGTLGYAVSNTLGFINSAFAAIGSQGDVADNGFWGALGFKENIVAKGIDAVKGAGEELTNIATGLTSFQTLVDRNINWDVLADTIKKSLTFVGDAFAAIGGMETEDTGLFGIKWDENSVEKGIDAVSGAGKELTQIATGLTSFQNLVEKNIKWDVLGNAVKKSLTFVGDAFSAIGGKESKDSAFFGLIEWDENTVAKGISAVKGAGKALTDIAMGLTKFAELKDPAGLSKNIAVLLTNVGTTFSATYKANPMLSLQLKDFGNFINTLGNRAKDKSLEKAAKDIGSIAKSINSINPIKAQSMSNLFKYGSEMAKKPGAETIKALVKAVEDIKKILETPAPTPTAALSPSVAVAGSSGVPAVTPKTASTAPPKVPQADIMIQLQTTLSQINATLRNLPSAISQIEIKVPER
jgi:hypothetical protein